MKRSLRNVFLLFAIVYSAVNTAKGQDINNEPVAYMNAMSTAETQMNKSYMAYISAAAHSSRKKKIEKLRVQAVSDIVTCQGTINNLPAYKGDNTLKQHSLAYVQLCYKVFNNDYAHIVNMEDIAERTYDEMQAYLLLEQATNDTLAVAIKRVHGATQAFADKYHINLTEEKTELGDKMEATGRLNKYHNQVYLLFYKCNWEDGQLTGAINQKNVTKIEQMRSALKQFANEGLAVLDTMKVYENDASLAQACRQALAFYKTEAETGIPVVTDFFLKEENFNKLKAAIDAKPANQRTKEDVDTYNKAVADMNSGVNLLNQTNNNLNANRTAINNNWMAIEAKFIDAHTPYYK